MRVAWKIGPTTQRGRWMAPVALWMEGAGAEVALALKKERVYRIPGTILVGGPGHSLTWGWCRKLSKVLTLSGGRQFDLAAIEAAGGKQVRVSLLHSDRLGCSPRNCPGCVGWMELEPGWRPIRDFEGVLEQVAGDLLMKSQDALLQMHCREVVIGW